jgi:hypothetical protein
LCADTEAFDIKVETLDRHHMADILTPVNFADSRSELDFLLRPFNRTDAYIINVYVTYKESVGEITLSSPHSTRFVEETTIPRQKSLQIGLLLSVGLTVIASVFLLIPEERLNVSLKFVLAGFVLVMLGFGKVMTKIVFEKLDE